MATVAGRATQRAARPTQTVVLKPYVLQFAGFTFIVPRTIDLGSKTKDVKR